MTADLRIVADSDEPAGYDDHGFYESRQPAWPQPARPDQNRPDQIRPEALERPDEQTPRALTAADCDWTTRAVCATQDPDILFVTGAAQREAARMCRGCPVKLECLADALDNRVEFGVWGGLTERQRRALLKRCPDVTSWRSMLEEARAEATRQVAG